MTYSEYKKQILSKIDELSPEERYNFLQELCLNSKTPVVEALLGTGACWKSLEANQLVELKIDKALQRAAKTLIATDDNWRDYIPMETQEVLVQNSFVWATIFPDIDCFQVFKYHVEHSWFLIHEIEFNFVLETLIKQDRKEDIHELFNLIITNPRGLTVSNDVYRSIIACEETTAEELFAIHKKNTEGYLDDIVPLVFRHPALNNEKTLRECAQNGFDTEIALFIKDEWFFDQYPSDFYKDDETYYEYLAGCLFKNPNTPDRLMLGVLGCSCPEWIIDGLAENPKVSQNVLNRVIALVEEKRYELDKFIDILQGKFIPDEIFNRTCALIEKEIECQYFYTGLTEANLSTKQLDVLVNKALAGPGGKWWPEDYRHAFLGFCSDNPNLSAKAVEQIFNDALEGLSNALEHLNGEQLKGEPVVETLATLIDQHRLSEEKLNRVRETLEKKPDVLEEFRVNLLTEISEMSCAYDASDFLTNKDDKVYACLLARKGFAPKEFAKSSEDVVAVEAFCNIDKNEWDLDSILEGVKERLKHKDIQNNSFLFLPDALGQLQKYIETIRGR